MKSPEEKIMTIVDCVMEEIDGLPVKVGQEIMANAMSIVWTKVKCSKPKSFAEDILSEK